MRCPDQCRDKGFISGLFFPFGQNLVGKAKDSMHDKGNTAGIQSGTGSGMTRSELSTNFMTQSIGKGY